MDNTFLTIAIPFDARHLDRVDATLKSEGRAAYKGGYIRKALKNQGVHFLSITTVPGEPSHPAFLVIESSHDGGKSEALDCIATQLAKPLKIIFDAAEIEVAPDNYRSFLQEKSIETGQGLFSVPGLNHRGAPGMTVKRITQEFAFADKVRDFLAERTRSTTPLETLKDVRQHFAKDGEFSDMLHPEEVSFLKPAPEASSTASLILALGARGLLKFFWPLLIALGAASLYAIYTVYPLATWHTLIGPVLLAIAGALSWSGFLKITRPVFWIIIAAALLIVYLTFPPGAWLSVIGVTLLCLIGTVVALVATGGLVYAQLRRKERSDEPDDTTPDYETLSAVMAIENDGDNNHLAGISVMKPGLLRRLTLRLAFWVIGQVAALQYRPGFLGDLGTIHFARWVLLPGTDKLLFMSNYGGSWESYLEDFITKASDGLTGVWSNTYGFPRTRNLFQGGAADGDRFKRWARRQQRPSYFWYRAYPNTTTGLIRLNAAIRHGLIAASTEDEATDWLALFGSRRRKPDSLQVQEIQSIVFGAMRHLCDGTCYLLCLPDDPAKAREWLVGIEDDITFDDRKPVDKAITLAFTASGLSRLGLDRQSLREFPAAFQQGMAEPRRAKRVLMDTGDDEPSNWAWGNDHSAVDAALIVYAKGSSKKKDLSKVCDKPLSLLKELGGRKCYQVEMLPLPEQGHGKEAFGFVDGVSQPIVRGTTRWSKTKASPYHEVEAGEFILGYPDNRGLLPTTPTVPSTADPANILPALTATAVEHDWPLFERSQANRRHDLGLNGSYLVIRQLEQDKALFERSTVGLAKSLADHPNTPPGLTEEQLVIWVRAKLVGRWPDGTSLVRYPYAPGRGWANNTTKDDEAGNVASDAQAGQAGAADDVRPDNDFLLGAEDPEGYRCPFSAHIRRANPRDSFVPGSLEQLAISNRHRILRVGRRYEQADDAKSAGPSREGLLFMCLNGDLERQFEFIQQTWVMSRLFHGLRNEVDALLGRGGRGGRLTVPTPDGPAVLKPLEDYVRVRGGGYFFLPGRSAVRYLARLD